MAESQVPHLELPFFAPDRREYPLHEGMEQKVMKVESVPPDSVTEPRHWVRHDQAFAMMLGPGSIEWGSKRFATQQIGDSLNEPLVDHPG